MFFENFDVDAMITAYNKKFLTRMEQEDSVLEAKSISMFFNN